ncbi:MAG TPA: glycosyltransferase family 2 protein [Kofleriaceae bacterium]
MRVLLIIPAYNEQDALGGLLSEIRALPASDGLSLETLVIDDGSADRTAEIAAQGGARVIRLCRNVGIGGAVQSGLRIAFRERFDAAVQIDGDGQHPPSEIARLLEPARAATPPDLIVGTRYRDKTNFRSTPMRRLGSWWLRVVLRMIARIKVSDPTSGYRVYGPRALRLFSDTYPYDFPEPESLAIARAAGLSVAEVPVQMRERQGGRSSIAGLSTIYYMFKVTIAVVLTYMRTLGRNSKHEHTP